MRVVDMQFWHFFLPLVFLLLLSRSLSIAKEHDFLGVSRRVNGFTLEPYQSKVVLSRRLRKLPPKYINTNMHTWKTLRPTSKVSALDL